MSRNRPFGSRTYTQTNKHIKNSNIQLFKLADPIGQSILFILFLFCIDGEMHLSYRTLLYCIIGWQLLSCCINFLLVNVKLLVRERLAYIVSVILCMAVYYYLRHNVPEHLVALNEMDKPTIPLHEMIIATITMSIAFWYNVICFREFKKIFGSINRGNNK